MPALNDVLASAHELIKMNDNKTQPDGIHSEEEMKRWYRKTALIFHQDKISLIQPEPSYAQREIIEKGFLAIVEINQRYFENIESDRRVGGDKKAKKGKKANNNSSLNDIAREIYIAFENQINDLQNLLLNLNKNHNGAARSAQPLINVIQNLFKITQSEISLNSLPQHIAKEVKSFRKDVQEVLMQGPFKGSIGFDKLKESLNNFFNLVKILVLKLVKTEKVNDAQNEGSLKKAYLLNQETLPGYSNKAGDQHRAQTSTSTPPHDKSQSSEKRKRR